jgi:hypothetical protein
MGVNYSSGSEALVLSLPSRFLGIKELLQSLFFFERITNISFKDRNALKVALHS